MNRMMAPLFVSIIAARALAGDLNPPAGPIAPTPGPEPRIAINATNTPGDASSVYRITAPGSYYLTGNVTGAAGMDGIAIASDDVTVDLMGFEVLGVAGSGRGVWAAAANLSGIEVRNGTVRGWGLQGLEFQSFTAQHLRVESIRAIGNSAEGIRVGAGTVIESCVADSNVNSGISADPGCTITGCVARSNSQYGILTSSACSVTRCASSLNGFIGIGVGSASVVSECTAIDNGGTGILGGVSAVVTRCTAYSNDADGIAGSVGVRIIECNSAANIGDGIEVSGDAAVIGNSCDSNGFGAADGAGIHVTSSDCRIEGNNCTDSDRGIDVDNAGALIIRNTCSGNTTNFDIAIGNAVAPIVNASTNAGAINGSTYAGSLGSTDPNANFSY